MQYEIGNMLHMATIDRFYSMCPTYKRVPLPGAFSQVQLVRKSKKDHCLQRKAESTDQCVLAGGVPLLEHNSTIGEIAAPILLVLNKKNCANTCLYL